MAENHDTLEKVISLCRRRGFIFQSSEVYGGFAGFWDYGPLGVELRHNIKQLWWDKFISSREDLYGISTSIIMNPRVWEASGHVGGFADPVVECNKCHSKFRVDALIKDPSLYKAVEKEFEVIFYNLADEIQKEQDETGVVIDLAFKLKSQIEKEDIPIEAKKNLLEAFIKVVEEASRLYQVPQQKIKKLEEMYETLSKSQKFIGAVAQTYLERYEKCIKCNSMQWSEPQGFNVMFKTQVGAGEESTTSYLRPETAQGMFANFKNVLDSMHPKLPFGLAQIGKAFRNEISPRDFIFRSREFEQMEIEYFVKESEWEKRFEEWRVQMHEWMDLIGIPRELVHELEVPAEDRAHYSKRTIDFEFDFPFGRKELYGLAYRTDFDLKNHAASSGVDISYFDEESKERFVPHVIEPTFGVDRTVLAVLSSAYTEDELGGENRIYLKFKKDVAPIRAAVFPLLKNKPELVAKAREVYKLLKNEFSNVEFDDNGNIGKRYRRQDEIGTPFCITIDFDTFENDTVTLRDRDSGEQKRVSIAELKAEIA